MVDLIQLLWEYLEQSQHVYPDGERVRIYADLSCIRVVRMVEGKQGDGSVPAVAVEGVAVFPMKSRAASVQAAALLADKVFEARQALAEETQARWRQIQVEAVDNAVEKLK